MISRFQARKACIYFKVHTEILLKNEWHSDLLIFIQKIISMEMKRYLKLLLFLLLTQIAFANEGMWLPQLLGQLNEKEMKSLGMKISASDIYDINKGSLKDAIVSFGGFCTGEVISDRGLVLTNHHCGFDAVQNHSTLEHNYLRDGFWAKTYSEEMPNPGLFVTFIVRIDDITREVLKGVNDSMSEKERQSAIDININEARKTAKKETSQESLVRSFFDGNKYYLFVTETYRDVRLVGAPPSSIGNFGKDTDNWMWPRHTGDFSMFRIYAGSDNKPADYSPNNVPYKPKRSLSISLNGVKEGDFTMVFGFPGRTFEYLPASAVEQIVTINDPAKIIIREKALAIIDEDMRKSEEVKIQYAAKYAGIQNAYKKWQGEVLGINRTKALDRKRSLEAEFQKRVDANQRWKKLYGSVLSDLNTAYGELKPLGFARDYYSEVMNRLELFTVAREIYNLHQTKEKHGEKAFTDALPGTKQRLRDFYKEYNANVDKRLFAALMQLFVTNQDKNQLAPELIRYLDKVNWNYQKLADTVYDDTELDNAEKSLDRLEKDPMQMIEDIRTDKVNLLLLDINNTYNKNVASDLSGVQVRINQLQRTYTQAQIEVFKEKRFYPDANSTIRVSYGKVKRYEPRNAVTYNHYTYLDGVMEKYKPGDYEFDVPQKLIDLYNSKDFGKYGSNGKMPVCFIADNHTTGGNSGSPALDANGNLIGLNFDRVWEGTMSDLNYDSSICRNIMIDLRYVLFIVDKYAGATNLIKEMKLVGGNRSN